MTLAERQTLIAQYAGGYDEVVAALEGFSLRRIGVSAAFFIELVQQTGFVAYRMHRAAFGLRSAPEQTRARVDYLQFMSDRAQIIAGPQLTESAQAFANRFVQRNSFVAEYPLTQTNAQFVNKLFDTASLSGAQFEAVRQAEIDAMNPLGRTRAQVLLNLINLDTFRQREYNPAFVLMQYFGYLRRNPDQAAMISGSKPSIASLPIHQVWSARLLPRRNTSCALAAW